MTQFLVISVRSLNPLFYGLMYWTSLHNIIITHTQKALKHTMILRWCFRHVYVNTMFLSMYHGSTMELYGYYSVPWYISKYNSNTRSNIVPWCCHCTSACVCYYYLLTIINVALCS